MKRIAIILFLLFSLCVPAHAVNFVEIVDVSDMMMISIDTDSIEKRIDYDHEYIVAWAKYVLPGGEGNAEYYLNFLAFSEINRQLQVLSALIYNEKNDDMIYSESRDFSSSGYEDIAPGSSGEMIYDFVMSYYYQNK